MSTIYCCGHHLLLQSPLTQYSMQKSLSQIEKVKIIGYSTILAYPPLTAIYSIYYHGHHLLSQSPYTVTVIPDTISCAIKSLSPEQECKEYLIFYWHGHHLLSWPLFTVTVAIYCYSHH